jgi:hypothetical protein
MLLMVAAYGCCVYGRKGNDFHRLLYYTVRMLSMVISIARVFAAGKFALPWLAFLCYNRSFSDDEYALTR